MILVCDTCRRHWVLPARAKRQKTCPKCLRDRRSKGQVRGWRRRKLARMPAGALEIGGPRVTPEELKELMDRADRAGKKAIQAIGAVHIPRKAP
jgi:hypothetical protein